MTNRARLRAWMRGTDTAAKDLAEDLGVATSTIRNLRNGHLRAPGGDLRRDLERRTGGAVPSSMWPRTRARRRK